MRNLVRSFVGRVRRGDLINAVYLTYYYSYLMAYDLRHGTRFAVSHKPTEMESAPIGGATGNFPAHPRLVRLFLNKCDLRKDTPIIDVGHGSGIVLHVASQMGYTNLTGIEYGKIPFDLSVKNLGGKAHLVHGDAFTLDLSPFEAVFFFSPFRGEMAVDFFSRISDNIKTILTINHDTIVEPLLVDKGFHETFSYRHPIYKNFNGKIWKR